MRPLVIDFAQLESFAVFFAGHSYQRVVTRFGQGSALVVLAIVVLAVLWHWTKRRHTLSEEGIDRA